MLEVLANIGENHPEGIAVYNLQVEQAHTYFVGAEGADTEPVWVHNADYVLRRNNLRYDADVDPLVDNAIRYRIANDLPGTGNNVTIVRLNNGDYLPFANEGDLHSEGVAWRELTKKGYTVNDIDAFYTERSPCADQCQPLLRSIRLPEDKVFWSFDYNISSLRPEFGPAIDAAVVRATRRF
jgi:hypothetical protein